MTPLPFLRRVAGLAVGIALIAAACVSGNDPVNLSDGTDPRSGAVEGPDGVTAEAFEVDQVASSDRSPMNSALRGDVNNEAFPDPIIDPALLILGNPRPDGIPPIDTPKFLRPDDVGFLSDNSPVISVDINGDARAYPLMVMTWHELVNDTVGGEPVTVSFCPLCNSAVAYSRDIGDGLIVDFGTSGLLYRSSLVMYDRQTETLWSHFSATAVVGELAGTELELFPLSIVDWASWRDANPDGLVLSLDTGHDRQYGANPYAGYDDASTGPFEWTFDPDELDSRLLPKERIIAIRSFAGEDPVAVLTSHAASERVVQVEQGTRSLVVFHIPGQASALDSSLIDNGRDIGSSGVFIAESAGAALTFAADGDRFIDQLGTSWDIFGTAISGPAKGEQLQAVEHLDTFWFAWGAFEPTTTIVGSPTGP